MSVAPPSPRAQPNQWSPSLFDVRVRRKSSTVRVTPVGDLDVATVGRVDRALHDVRDLVWNLLELDLRELTFMDSTGLHLAISWHAATLERGREFAIITGPPAVQRVFTIAGATDRLPFRLAAWTPRAQSQSR